jgi:molecular chaperone DnaK (HSP70)
MKQAASLADLQVLRVINEPTAAALAHELNEIHEGYLMVYHHDGCLLDASLLFIEDGVFEILAIADRSQNQADMLDKCADQSVLEIKHLDGVQTVGYNLTQRVLDITRQVLQDAEIEKQKIDKVQMTSINSYDHFIQHKM